MIRHEIIKEHVLLHFVSSRVSTARRLTALRETNVEGRDIILGDICNFS